MKNIFSKTKTLIVSNKTISLVLFFLILGLFTLNFNTSKRLKNKIDNNKAISINQDKLKNIGIVSGEEIENPNLVYADQKVLADQSTDNQPVVDESFIKKILKKFKFGSKNIKRHAIESDDIDSKSVTSRTIKNNTIKGKDIKDGTIGGDKIKSDIDLTANSVTSNTITTTGDVTVGGTIYGTVSGSSSSFSGDMAGDPILNIGDNGTDFSGTGGLTLADVLTVSSGGINVTGNSSINGTLNLNNNAISNIGAAGTDFSAAGGLTLADVLTVSSGGASITGDSTVTGDLTVTGTATIAGVTERVSGTNSFIDFTGDDITLDAGGDGVDATIAASNGKTTFSGLVTIERNGSANLTIKNTDGASVPAIFGGVDDGSTSTALDDVLFRFWGAGRDTGYSFVKGFEIVADAEWGTASDPSDNPTRFVIYTTPDGTNTSTERMRVSNDGSINMTSIPAGTGAGNAGVSGTAAGTVLCLTSTGDLYRDTDGTCSN